MADNVRAIFCDNTMTLFFTLRDPRGDVLSMQIMHIGDIKQKHTEPHLTGMTYITGKHLPRRWIRFLETHKFSLLEQQTGTPKFVARPDDRKADLQRVEWMNRQLQDIFSSTQIIDLKIQYDSSLPSKYVVALKDLFQVWTIWLSLPQSDSEEIEQAVMGVGVV